MNVNNLNLQELNAQEVQEIDGGIIFLSISQLADIYSFGYGYVKGLKDGLSGI